MNRERERHIRFEKHGRAHLTGVSILVLGGFGVLLGMGSFTFRYAEGTSYLSNDPEACVNCHIMRDQYEGWLKSTHHNVATCNDCHVPQDFLGKYLTKIEHGYRHSKGFTFQDFHEPIQITNGSRNIVQTNCVRCHESLVQELDVHSGKEDCAHCHSGIGHSARP
jgi:cytochrome c nitrite reductase small subunit